jgi:hypothetical protein
MTVEEKPSSTAASIFKKIHTAAGFQKGYAFINCECNPTTCS